MIAPLTCIVAICLLPCAEGTMRSSQAAQRPVNGHAKASANSGNPHLPTRPGGSQSTGSPADKSRRLKGASAQGSITSAAAAQRRKTPARPRKPSPPKSNAKGAASAQHEKPEGDALVKMVVSAALANIGEQQDGSAQRTSMSIHQLQDQIMGSFFFAGPGFQLPPTPERLPLPSSSLLQKPGRHQ